MSPLVFCNQTFGPLAWNFWAGRSELKYEYDEARGLLAVGPEVLAPPSAGWQHVGERWYDPTTGRFLQRDPIGIRGGLNPYIFGLNSPLTRIDPNGAMPVWVAQSILWATDRFHAVTGIDPDNDGALRAASDGFAAMGGAAAAGVVVCAAPVLVAAGGTVVDAGTSGGAASVVAVTVEQSTKHAGGLKITCHMYWNNAMHWLDTIITRTGAIPHQHWRSSPPDPPIPPYLQ